jgi:hypothetical protein
MIQFQVKIFTSYGRFTMKRLVPVAATTSRFTMDGRDYEREMLPLVGLGEFNGSALGRHDSHRYGGSWWVLFPVWGFKYNKATLYYCL